MYESTARDRSNLWIRRFQPAPAAPSQLVCLSHAGGSAGYFLPVARAMPTSVDVLAVQYPGRQDRSGEPCVEDVHELADLLVRELEPWADRPFTLFGHSLGASLAFETAVRLERAGIEVRGVVASGRRAPSRHREERVHLLDDRALIRDLERLSGTDPKMLRDPEILAMILPYIRSDYKAAELYRSRPGADSVQAPILVLTGDADPHVTDPEAAAWSEHTSGDFSRRVFPGGHFFLNDHALAIIPTIAEFIGANRELAGVR
ncbi:thioesterase II family protein [Streptomyces sp. NRRL WC-3742]|uniref:thioesterase II family protein n=1 Tax=Streptomyces sp. NRRL WC-3742 TaxID=1463934 RepID=UPI0004C85C3E|nr:alpha/beta fold hydrolase [Streptomyces sp. NRRL WC-3742]